jgi:hypothetical protein
MFLPTGDHHVLLMRDRRRTLMAEAEYERLGLRVAASKPNPLRRLRRALGNALIRVGRWVRGPERPLASPSQPGMPSAA